MPLIQSDYFKIHTSVPVDSAENVRRAMTEAGAGQQGAYSGCSGSVRSIGRFIPGQGSNPSIGKVGKEEQVEEEIIEVICHKDKVENAVAAIKKAHPYEEPAIDIFPRFDVS